MAIKLRNLKYKKFSKAIMFLIATVLMFCIMYGFYTEVIYDYGQIYGQNATTIINNYDKKFNNNYLGPYISTVESLTYNINDVEQIQKIEKSNKSIHETLDINIDKNIESGVRYVLFDENNNLVGNDGITPDDLNYWELENSSDVTVNMYPIEKNVYQENQYNANYNLFVFYDAQVSNEINTYYNLNYIDPYVARTVMLVLGLILLMIGIYFAIVSGKNRFDDDVKFSFLDSIFIDFIMFFAIVVFIFISLCFEGIKINYLSIDELKYGVCVIFAFILTTIYVFACSNIGKKIRTRKFFNSISIVYITKLLWSKIVTPLSEILSMQSSISIILTAVFYFITVVLLNNIIFDFIAFLIFINSIRLVLAIISLKKNGSYVVKNSALNFPYISAFNDVQSISESLSKVYKEGETAQKTKTELITNVSHDLRTPLTSIIGYVDLLSKKSNEYDDETNEYVKVLKEKSERMNTMVSDLFDLAKTASGEANFNIEQLNVKKLVEQTLSELDDVIDDEKFIIKIDESLFINGDGNKMYRVIQNLVENAMKYSLDNTRIYIDGYGLDGEVYIEFKNTANYKMNFTSEEIIQRFNRGDESRTTKGSGLGLSIAKTYTNFNNGKFDVIIDGDMFKVVMIF